MANQNVIIALCGMLMVAGTAATANRIMEFNGRSSIEALKAERADLAGIISGAKSSNLRDTACARFRELSAMIDAAPLHDDESRLPPIIGDACTTHS